MKTLALLNFGEGGDGLLGAHFRGGHGACLRGQSHRIGERQAARVPCDHRADVGVARAGGVDRVRFRRNRLNGLVAAEYHRPARAKRNGDAAYAAFLQLVGGGTRARRIGGVDARHCFALAFVDHNQIKARQHVFGNLVRGSRVNGNVQASFARFGKCGPGGFVVAFQLHQEHVARLGYRHVGVDQHGDATGQPVAQAVDQLGYEGAAKEAFLAQIEEYNQYCEDGADQQFGRDAQVLFPVKQAPFYAVKFEPQLGETMVTCGGILTDGEQNAIDKNYEPIPGLYVSGNDCGRRFGIEYVTPIPGCSLGMAITLGRECGKSVCKFLDAQA